MDGTVLAELLDAAGVVDAARLCEALRDHHPGAVIYDPGLSHTAACVSAITEVDAGGRLRYRGYAADDLCRLDYLDVAFLLAQGKLPDRVESRAWREAICIAGARSASVCQVAQSLPVSADPHSVLVSVLAAWAATAEKQERSASVGDKILGLLGVLPLAAGAALRPGSPSQLRHLAAEEPYALGLLANLAGSDELRPSPVLTRALNSILIALADHEQACSTTVLRAVTSAGGTFGLAVVAAVAAVAGRLHGSSSVIALRQFRAIGGAAGVPLFIDRVKSGQVGLAGFGHRIRIGSDPRAQIIRAAAVEVAAVSGIDQALGVALALEAACSEDDFFRSRDLFPNVEFYSAVAFDALGFPPPAFSLVFAVARAGGWIAHWREAQEDPEQRMIRPRQLYRGPSPRTFPRTDT
ncbi:MAG: hypothetical protein EOR51_29970 [Mesorhizobium sp.]|nr:MAG: hypothetical protein EOR51_29970 [Mesorhizobium sp.]